MPWKEYQRLKRSGRLQAPEPKKFQAADAKALSRKEALRKRAETIRKKQIERHKFDLMMAKEGRYKHPPGRGRGRMQ